MKNFDDFVNTIDQKQLQQVVEEKLKSMSSIEQLAFRPNIFTVEMLRLYHYWLNSDQSEK